VSLLTTIIQNVVKSYYKMDML